MSSDPNWHIEASYRLIEQSEKLTQSGREQVAQSRALIAEARRIMGLVRPNFGRDPARRYPVRLGG